MNNQMTNIEQLQNKKMEIERHTKLLNISLDIDINYMEENMKLQLESVNVLCMYAGICNDLQNIIEQNVISLQRQDMERKKKFHARCKNSYLRKLEQIDNKINDIHFEQRMENRRNSRRSFKLYSDE